MCDANTIALQRMKLSAGADCPDVSGSSQKTARAERYTPKTTATEFAGN